MPEWLIVVVGAAGLAITWSSTRIEAGTHRNALRCTVCGYSLDGLGITVRCPECGEDDARLRHEIARVKREYSVLPSRAGAYLILCGLILLGSWVRHRVIIREYEQTAIEWYEPPGLVMYYAPDEWGGLGSATWLLLVAGVMTWVLGHRRGGMLVRAVVTGLVIFVAACVDAWLMDPRRSISPTARVWLGVVCEVAGVWYVWPGLWTMAMVRWTRLCKLEDGSSPGCKIHGRST